MIVLVYLLCALAAPAQCEEHRAPAPSLMACLTGAQAELAGPLAQPGWRAVRWRCE